MVDDAYWHYSTLFSRPNVATHHTGTGAKVNTAAEFLNVISSLHYQNPNHLDMARKKMRYFLYFIRAKYNINTQNFTGAFSGSRNDQVVASGSATFLIAIK